MNSESSGGILIRTPNWLGDLMMSTAFIHQVMELFPECEVDLVVRIGFEELPLPCRGRVLSFDKKTQTPGSIRKIAEAIRISEDVHPAAKFFICLDGVSGINS